jgi:ornithine carbamoyltransferase
MNTEGRGVARKRDFLTVDSLSVNELIKVLDLADTLKADRRQRDDLKGHTIAMIFEKPSTRTRVSFEVAIAELGATPVVLNASDLQLGRGETIEDTAQVLSRYVHAVVVRTFAQSRLEALATGTIPVINALSDFSHPCQALADMQTIREHKGGLAGVKLAYVGDGNNVTHSLLEAGALLGLHVAVATPAGYEPLPQVVENATREAADSGGSVTITNDPVEAVADADVVYTDVWASMGQEAEQETRALLFRPYQVSAELIQGAKPNAIVMHCLPAHRGEEISADIIDGPQSVVFDQAENRLHSQKALLLTLLG